MVGGHTLACDPINITAAYVGMRLHEEPFDRTR